MCSVARDEKDTWGEPHTNHNNIVDRDHKNKIFGLEEKPLLSVLEFE